MSFKPLITSAQPCCILLMINTGILKSPGQTRRKGFLRRFGRPASRDHGSDSRDRMLAAVNRFIHGRILQGWNGETIFEYFEIGVLGYELNGDDDLAVANLLPMRGRVLHAMAPLWEAIKVQHSTMRDLDPQGSLVESPIDNPIWIDSTSHRQPTRIDKAIQELENWCSVHHDSVRPMIIHVATDERCPSALVQAMRALKNLHTDDGGALLCNCVWTSSNLPRFSFPDANTPISANDVTRVLLQEASMVPETAARWFDPDKPGKPPSVKAFGVITAAEEVSGFFKHMLELLPDIGTEQSRKEELAEERKNALTQGYQRNAEERARNQEQRAKRSQLYALIAIIISALSLVLSALQFLLKKH